MLTSLRSLYLTSNQITDEGCAVLASALRGGALPALGERLGLDGNPLSEEAMNAESMLSMSLFADRES